MGDIMVKIDMKNVLYHGILYDDFKWKIFEDILKDRYLYSAAILRGEANPLNPYYDTHVCLASHPEGDYAHKCRDYYDDSMDGYSLSQHNHLGFIIDSKILTEQECMTEGMSVDNEILVKDKISLEQYALGIYNAGGTIREYEVQTYLNVLERIKSNECHSDGITLNHRYININDLINSVNNEGLGYFISNKEDYLKVKELIDMIYQSLMKTEKKLYRLKNKKRKF